MRNMKKKIAKRDLLEYTLNSHRWRLSNNENMIAFHRFTVLKNILIIIYYNKLYR